MGLKAVEFEAAHVLKFLSVPRLQLALPAFSSWLEVRLVAQCAVFIQQVKPGLNIECRAGRAGKGWRETNNLLSWLGSSQAALSPGLVWREARLGWHPGVITGTTL